MNTKKVIKDINPWVETEVEKLGYELVDIELKTIEGDYHLIIYIDKIGGVSLDDCQKTSEVIGEILDEKDPIPVSYYLEVSSPGLDRPLKTDKDLNRNIGRDIEMSLYQNFNGRKKIEGSLDGFNSESISVGINGEVLSIPRDIISIIKLAIKF